jgi:hypothetical protein
MLLGACSAAGAPTQVSGDGSVAGQLDCLAIAFDSGASYPVSYWPTGYTARRSPGATANGALLDSSGATVLHEGDRVHAVVEVTHSSGDTRCSSTAVVTVVDFRVVTEPTQVP